MSKTVKEHYMETEQQLLRDNVPRASVANQFKSFAKIKSTLQKRRAKEVPAQLLDLQDIDLEGDFGLTLEYLKFVQYDSHYIRL